MLWPQAAAAGGGRLRAGRAFAVINRRQVLGGAAAAAAAGVVGARTADAAAGGPPNPPNPVGAPVTDGSGRFTLVLPTLAAREQAIFYPGIALVAATSANVAVGNIYQSNPAAGSYPSSNTGWVGIGLTPPIGSTLTGVDFIPYGQPRAGGVSVERYLPDTVGFDSTLGFESLSGNGVATVTVDLDEVYDGTQAYHAYHVGGSAANVCRGIRLRYVPPPTFANFHPIAPERVYDSRQAAYPVRGVLQPGTNRRLSVRDGRNAAGTVTAPDVVPPGAIAVALNVTAAAPTGPGFFAVTPGNATSTSASTLNFTTGVAVANGAIVALDSQRRVRVFCGGIGAAHLIIDVAGYFLRE